MATTSFKDSPVWQQSMQLAIDMYQLTANMPTVERLGLSTQLQHAAVCIPSRIAAGSRTGTRSGLREACAESLALLAEIETLLIIAGQQYTNVNTEVIMPLRDQVEQQISTLMTRLSGPAPARSAKRI